MQIFNLDISQKGIPPVLVVKQVDVGRKFKVILTDGGAAYTVPENAVFSIWYEGSSGVGNYSTIEDRPAVVVDGNVATVEVVAQMVTNAGGGNLCLVLNAVDGSQIGLWNIVYIVEAVPGMGSKAAEDYYTAFSQSAASLAQSAETIGKSQERIDSIIKSRNATAAGLIYPLASSNVPSGFLLCDGAEYSRTEYAELFEAIGTVYGEGDGETTFNVPNLQTRVPVGVGNGYELGDTGGEEKHTLTVDEMPVHRHTGIWDNSGGSEWGINWGVEKDVASGGAGAMVNQISVQETQGLMTNNEGGNQPHNIMQPYTVVNYIISTGKEVEFVVSGVGEGGSGVDGTTFYPSVSADGVISWTNDGGKQNPDPVDLVAAVIAALPVYNGEVEAV